MRFRWMFAALLVGCASGGEVEQTLPLTNDELLALQVEDLAPEEVDAPPSAAGRRQIRSYMVTVDALWNQPVVTVAFNGGDVRAHDLIVQTAEEWTNNSLGHFRLDFGSRVTGYRTWNSNDNADTANVADIRIGFDPNANTHSAVGVTARQYRLGASTMNFNFADKLVAFYNGARASDWRQSYYRRAILHEFGHALGLQHEHFHEACQRDLDVAAAVTHLQALSPAFTEAIALRAVSYDAYQRALRDKGIVHRYAFSSRIDRASIMMYSLPPSVTFRGRRGEESPCVSEGPGARPAGNGAMMTTQLSPGDRRYFSLVYDRPLSRRPR